jgi:hypothetical protein
VGICRDQSLGVRQILVDRTHVGIGDGLASKHPLILSTLYRSVGFLIVLGLLTVVEEIIMGYLRRESVAHSLGSIGGGTLWQFIATSVILLLLVPWFAFRALGEVIGDETLARLFLSRAGNDKIDDCKHDFVNLLGQSKIRQRKELRRNHLAPDFCGAGGGESAKRRRCACGRPQSDVQGHVRLPFIAKCNFDSIFTS